MNFKVLSVLLLIALVSLDFSDAWSRRRRRGKGGWFRKTVKKVGKVVKKGVKVVKKGIKIYKKYKPHIHTAYKIGSTVAKFWKDQGSLDNIRALKNQDQDSYLEFMESMKDAFENAYPELDSEEFVEAFDNMVDMEPDEFEEMVHLFENEEDANQEGVADVNQEEVADAFKDLEEELAMRVATL